MKEEELFERYRKLKDTGLGASSQWVDGDVRGERIIAFNENSASGGFGGIRATEFSGASSGSMLITGIIPIGLTDENGEYFFNKAGWKWAGLDESPEMVNHPKHYNTTKIEVIDVIEDLSFCKGNAVKYVLRAEHKGEEIRDLRKAVWYLEREIAKLEKDE